MALIYADRVKETTTTTGTGTYTLAGAVAGYQTFADAMSNSDTCYYCVADGTNWEVGLGTYSTGTLARTSILSSSNADSAVNWTAGTRNVFITYPASNIVGLTDAQTLTNKTLTSPVLNTGVSGTAVKDEDNMASNSATHLATQQSIKAYVDAAITTAKSALYPVGVIYTNITGTNPATELGFGTWAAFGAGRTPVGYDSGDTDFNTAEETGGAKTVAGAAHTHPLSSAGGVPYGLDSTTTRVTRNGPTVSIASANNESTSWGGGSGTITSSLGLVGATDSRTPTATSVVQPYIVVHFWKRTA